MRYFLSFILFFFLCPLMSQAGNMKWGVIEIDHPENYSRVFAISDVHGSYKATLRVLVAAKIASPSGDWVAGKSILIVNGDSIDKGDNSVEVIDLWLTLATKALAYGGEVIHVLGNHEGEFLANPLNQKASDFRAELVRREIPIEQMVSPVYPRAAEPGNPRGRFLRWQPIAARIGKWLFCHSGHYPDMPWPNFVAMAAQIHRAGDYRHPFLSGNSSILNDHDWMLKNSSREDVRDRLMANGIWGLVFGHTPDALSSKGDNTRGRIATAEKLRMIKIDVGMAKENGNSNGQVLVFMKPAQMRLPETPEMGVYDQSGTLTKLN